MTVRAAHAMWIEAAADALASNADGDALGWFGGGAEFLRELCTLAEELCWRIWKNAKQCCGEFLSALRLPMRSMHRRARPVHAEAR